MSENTGISWAHHTQNFWLGCDKVAAECAHCYIDRILQRQHRKPWGEIYLTKTWQAPRDWQKDAEQLRQMRRVFTCSLSDFFHAKADQWRPQAWKIIKETPNLVWLVLTKRPALVEKRLPADWPYPNVWLGVSTGTRKTLDKMDVLRKIPIHPKAVRWISSEPLLEDISGEINLGGFGWVVTGGESGGGTEYLWDSTRDFKYDFDAGGRRTMALEWAAKLRDVTKKSGLPFMFKQVTAAVSGTGVNALGRDWHEYPEPHLPYPWMPQPAIDPKHLFTPPEIERFVAYGSISRAGIKASRTAKKEVPPLWHEMMTK